MGLWNIDAARIAKVRGEPLEEAVAAWDRARDGGLVAAANEQRKRLLDLFPISDWPALPLERYALGTGVEDSFCRLMEFGTQALGGIGGGSAKKHLIYRKSDGSWYFRPDYADEREAWEAVRGAFVRGFELAQAGDWAAIDALPAIANASSLRAKTYCTYFLEDHIPIFSTPYQAHFYRLLGGEGPAPSGVAGTRALRQLTAASGLFNGWHPSEIATFLGAWSPPGVAHRIVKIAPGPDAKFWSECRSGGYICVGWDKVGDLKQFESKEAFRRAFGEAYPEYSPSKATEKANELWTLMELLPGDIVLANKGTSEVLGRGEVVEPGYSWQPERGEWAFHTVAVGWEANSGREIDPIKHWAMTTVSPVSAEQYKRILEGVSVVGEPPTSSGSPVSIPPDPLLAEIAATIERKGQVVLYGPPGTGKTYNARRFSVWWLSERTGIGEATSLLGDSAAFRRAESRFSTAQIDRRVWWLVANPKEWSWDRLRSEKTVAYRRGRLQRNYPLVQPGDLVIG
jgi:5-methylcytosine-specific restriction protein B